jgi:hypothetical protein
LNTCVCLWAATHGLAQLLAVKGEELKSEWNARLPDIVETFFSMINTSLGAPEAKRRRARKR